MENIDIRDKLDTLIRERGVSYSKLSEMLGRNPAYIQQFIRKGSPRKLDESDRRILAEFFGVMEETLGAPPHRVLQGVKDKSSGSAFDGMRFIPRLSVGASAGSGAYNDDELQAGRIACDDAWLKKIGVSVSSEPSIIQVDGDSMEPNLKDGDDILVDRSDTRPRDGIYVIRMDDMLMVKRLAFGPGGRLSVISDNPQYPSYDNVERGNISIIGRVVWRGEKV